jgi:hypothetical protein
MIQGIVRATAPTKRQQSLVSDDVVNWLADFLLFAEEPLSLRRGRGTASMMVDGLGGGESIRHDNDVMFFKDVKEFETLHKKNFQ